MAGITTFNLGQLIAGILATGSNNYDDVSSALQQAGISDASVGEKILDLLNPVSALEQKYVAFSPASYTPNLTGGQVSYNSYQSTTEDSETGEVTVTKNNVVGTMSVSKIIKAVMASAGLVVASEVFETKTLITNVVRKLFNKSDITEDEVDEYKALVNYTVDDNEQLQSNVNTEVIRNIFKALDEEGVFNTETSVIRPVYNVGDTVKFTRPVMNKQIFTRLVSSMANKCLSKISAGTTAFTVNDVENLNMWQDDFENAFLSIQINARWNFGRFNDLLITIGHISDAYMDSAFPIESVDCVVGQPPWWSGEGRIVTQGVGYSTGTKYYNGIQTSYIMEFNFSTNRWYLYRADRSNIGWQPRIDSYQYYMLPGSSPTDSGYRGYGWNLSPVANLEIQEPIEGISQQEGVLPYDNTKTLEEQYLNWFLKQKQYDLFDKLTGGLATTKLNTLPLALEDTDVLAPVDTTQDKAQNGVIPIDATVVAPAILSGVSAGVTDIDLVEALNPSVAIDKVTTPQVPPSNTPVLPVIPSVGGAGLATIYNPTASEMSAIKGSLWNESALAIIKNIFTNNPMDAIIDCSIVYVTPTTTARQPVKLGYYTCTTESGNVTSKVVSNQYVALDCGTVNVSEIYGDSTDYEPFTSVGVYLPFIGIKELSANDVIGSTMNITYKVDVATGTCLAMITLTKSKGRQTLYTFEGNCSVKLPITASSFNLKGMLAGGTALAGGVLTGNPMMAIQGGLNLGSSIAPSIHSSGSISGNAGAMAVKKPYVIIKHLIPYMANNYNAIYGYPSNVTTKLYNCSGFTKVREVHVDGIGCTDEERSMIEDSLLSGVIL